MTGSEEEIVLFSERDIEVASEMQDQLAARPGPAGLHIGEVASGHVRLCGQLELAQSPTSSPLAQEWAHTSGLFVHLHDRHASERLVVETMTCEVMASVTICRFSGGMTHVETSDRPSRFMATTIVRERGLRLVLRANAASSTISGSVMVMAPGVVDDLLGTGHPGWIRLVGAALLPFAVFVFWLSMSAVGHVRTFTPVIVAGDIGWVVASIATVALGWYSGAGNVAVLAMALLIEGFAIAQFSGWHHLRGG